MKMKKVLHEAPPWARGRAGRLQGFARPEGPAKPRRDHWLYDQGVVAIALKVGQTPEARLRWVADDFATHLNYSALPPEVTPAIIAREASLFLLYQLGPHTFDMAEMPEIPPAQFAGLAKDISDGLDAYLDDHEWLSRHAKVEWVTRAVRRDRKRDGNAHNVWRAPKPVNEGLPLMFEFAVMDLLQTDGWRLIRCAREDCNRRVVRRDKHQLYCGPRCSQTTRTKRLRAAPKEEM